MVTNDYYNAWLYSSSPEYLRAFQDGYDAAVREMTEKLNKMQAVTDNTGTFPEVKE